VNGRETKKWREEAIQASQDHSSGKWDDLSSLQRQLYWASGSAMPSANDVGTRDKALESSSIRGPDKVMGDAAEASEATKSFTAPGVPESHDLMS
jgi:hypothetical protein